MNWRIVLGATLFAVLLSLVAGLAGGNPFGVVLLRMLVSALILGGLAAGVQVVLRRFVPELSERLVEGGESTSGQVDIVIDGDIDEEPVWRAAEAALPIEGFEDDASPLEEVVGAERPFGKAEGSEGGSLEEPNEVEEAAEAEPVGEFAPLDTLPEMEHFSFEEVGGASPAPAPAGDIGGGRLDAVKDRQDPETLVKAVRTMMRRDQEG